MGHSGSRLEVMGMTGLAESGEMTWSEAEVGFMRQALKIAERGRGQVKPNPLVGCVLVKDGDVVAQGWHDHLGGLHAEQMAIADAEKRGISTNGTTAYVTLEPCNHHGRTPPCTEALLWAGITSVVVAHTDPNPTVRGNGCEYLRREGFAVKSGLLEDEAAVQMQSFLNWCEKRRPLVTLKIATDCNRAIDDLTLDSQRFTSSDSLDAVHRLRRECDAIIIGVETVVRDNPSLTVRRIDLGDGKQPVRIILDRELRIPLDSTVLVDEHQTLILHTEGKAENVAALSSRKNVEVVCLKSADSHDGVDLNRVLTLLGDREFHEIMVEGGAETARRFLAAGLIDRAIIIQTENEFSNPLFLGIESKHLIEKGLAISTEVEWGGDQVELWSRRELPWPSNNWP